MKYLKDGLGHRKEIFDNKRRNNRDLSISLKKVKDLPKSFLVNEPACSADREIMKISILF